MPAYTFYESDERIQQYAESLINRGDHVDVIALKKDGQKSNGRLNGVSITRVQKRIYKEKGSISYLLKILSFFTKASFILTKEHLKNPYDLIHVHSVPDFLVFVAWLPKLTGARVILDIHDILPEFYYSKFGKGSDSFLYKLLLLTEKLSIKFCHHVIIANDIWREKLLKRSVSDAKCTAILNYPNPNFFYKRPPISRKNKFIVMYPGSINWHQGIDLAVKAFSRIKSIVPQAELHIYGEGNFKKKLVQLVEELDLRDTVIIKPEVPLHEIAEIMSRADLGIVPKRSDSFGNEAFSTKTLQFMALGVPLLVSGTKIDRYYFNDSMVHFFKSGDIKSLVNCLIELIKNDELRMKIAENANEYIKNNTWDVKNSVYLDLVDKLTAKKNGHPV
jgi:glycosyltransferase involved in cell wall biosynthesis